jgi:LPPG:FO 2-phospho-L-lactate transferase
LITPGKNIVALSGGIGGAKLALGLYHVLAPHGLTVVTNTGDDFEHLGLHISPDTDTVMYTLAGVSNSELGWGYENETWNFMESLAQLGGEDWFRLGDRDLATSVLRTHELGNGKNLGEITATLASRLGIDARIIPMTDDPVRTIVEVEQSELSFQHYFVRDACNHVVNGFRFDGADQAIPGPGILDTLGNQELDAIIVCPSNPYISIDPILAIPGIRQALVNTSVPVIAVSPIIRGEAVKGPTAKIMGELGLPVSSLSVARHYSEFLNGIIVDSSDDLTRTKAGMAVLKVPTLMKTVEDKKFLAREAINFACQIR